MTNQSMHNGGQLADAGLIDESRVDDINRVAQRYSVAVTETVATLIDPSNPDDPIAQQFVPSVEELNRSDAELDDPTGDSHHSPVKGVIHRYPDRALLTPTHVCPVYCRYCFRREVVGAQGAGSLSSEELAECFAYFREHPEIWEVILTGGDPLVLSARRLAEIMQELSSIEHVRVVRIHSRVPTVAPEKISADLVQVLRSAQQAVFVVLHINHRDELASEARAACAQLIDAGIPVLSQTVLLRNVNDDPEELGRLMRALVENRIKPYYLHHCDLAPGTERFRTSIETGQSIVREMRGRFSGLCQPTYVLDIPGGAGKSPIGPNYLTTTTENQPTRAEYLVEDYQGKQHEYCCIADSNVDQRASKEQTDEN